MLLDKGEDSRGYLVICNGDNAVNILLAELECVLAGLHYLDAVCNGGNGVELFDLAVSQRLYHAGCACCLNAVNLYFGPELFKSECNA